MTSDARAIVALLRGEIELCGWSETARRSGVDRCTLHRCFGRSSKRYPSFQTLARVANVVGVSLTAAKLPTR